MSQNVCFDLTLYTYDDLQLVCRPLEAGEASVAETSAAASFATTTLPPFRSAGTERGPAVFQDSAEFRERLLASAFPEREAAPRRDWGNPFSYSLWSLFPSLTGCSSHPPLNGEEEDGGDSSGGSGGNDAGTVSPPPSFGAYTLQATSPCGAEGMVTDLDEELGVCANYVSGEHHLFSWNPTSPNAESILPLTYAPDQVLRASDGAIYISTHQNPGLAVVRPSPGNESHHAFPASLSLSGLSSGGRELSSLRPAYPKGLVEIGGRIFVSTSNYDEVNQDFQPGTVLAFDRETESFSYLPTSAFNPTGIAEAGGRLLVVNSGAIDRYGQATTDGSLDVFNPNTFELEASLPLGRRGAGLAGELALSADGTRVVLPTADNSGRILVVDWPSSQVREIDLRAAGIAGDRIFFSSLQVSEDGNYAVLGNFNDGRVYTVDLNQGELVASGLALDEETGDGRGLSDGLRQGLDYYVGRGSEILRLR